MTKQQFTEVLVEIGYDPSWVEPLYEKKPPEISLEIPENKFREAAGALLTKFPEMRVPKNVVNSLDGMLKTEWHKTAAKLQQIVAEQGMRMFKGNTIVQDPGLLTDVLSDAVEQAMKFGIFTGFRLAEKALEAVHKDAKKDN